jgi:hypothetical protein
MQRQSSAFEAFVVGAFLLVGSPVHGQTAQAVSDFSRLHEHLRPGDTIDVTMTDGTTFRGETLEISDTRLVVQANGSRKELGADQLVKIDRRRNGVLLGAIIGAGAGIPFGLAMRSYAYNEGGDQAGALILPILAGVGAGIAIDAALVRPRTVFSQSRQAVRELTVIVGHGRAGMQVRLTF